jgi:hypothetical protein
MSIPDFPWMDYTSFKKCPGNVTKFIILKAQPLDNETETYQSQIIVAPFSH